MSMDLFENAAEQDRQRLRQAGWLSAPAGKGQLAWKPPGSNLVLSEGEALALLERMETAKESEHG